MKHERYGKNFGDKWVADMLKRLDGGVVEPSFRAVTIIALKYNDAYLIVRIKDGPPARREVIRETVQECRELVERRGGKYIRHDVTLDSEGRTLVGVYYIVPPQLPETMN